MASLIDSTAQFDQRCKDINLSVGACAALKAAGVTSLGILAYSHGQPGQALSDVAFDAWVRASLMPVLV